MRNAVLVGLSAVMIFSTARAGSNKPIPKATWEAGSRKSLEPGEIDRLVLRELKADKISAAPRTTDEQFLRRVTIDLTGQLPVPADIREFAANKDPQKRAKVIDKLLASDEFARHWARYWRSVIASKITERRGLALGNAFEEWLYRQLKQNRGWDQIVREMLTAQGDCEFAEPEGKNGAIFFLASRRGPEAANERAAETARIFLGIQIQCAQCHDHPSDVWKREQFHAFAAYFARTAERDIRKDGQPIPIGQTVSSRPRGEQQMPSKEDPKKTITIHPRFLDNSKPGSDLNDSQRRRRLADAVVNESNYWFAGAFVNRLWGELMGQAFYLPVDDMGPQKEAVFADVLTRLAGAFSGSHYDTKELLRAICNSETYQRQIRLGESSDQHLHFAAAYPTRLKADAMWESLVGVLGNLSGGQPGQRPGPGQLFGGIRPGFEGQFKAEFEFDPSLKPDDVEGSVSQALLMMNSPILNGRIQARGSNLLARILTAYPEDDEAIKMVFLRTLARKPTDRELERSKKHLRTGANRNEGFEDLLWALLNSTEFQTKR